MAIRELAEILFPVRPSALEGALAGLDCLHIQTGRPEAFSPLVSWRQFNDFMTFDNVISGRVRILMAGRDLPIEMFTRFNAVAGKREIDPGSIADLRARGLSFAVNRLDELVPAVGAATAMLQRRLGIASGANAYASFKKGSAFRHHWDGHHVLALQLYGSKHWKTWGPQQAMPVDAGQIDDKSMLGEPEWEGKMEPGDVLFLPRGTIHTAQALDSHSLHLTFQIIPPRGIDFAYWLAKKAKDLAEFRGDLDPAGKIEPLLDQQARLRSALHQLIDGHELTEFIDDPSRTQPPYEHMSLGIEDAMAGDPWIALALRQPPASSGAGSAIVGTGKAATELAGAELDIVRFLLEHDCARLSELKANLVRLGRDELSGHVLALHRRAVVTIL